VRSENEKEGGRETAEGIFISTKFFPKVKMVKTVLGDLNYRIDMERQKIIDCCHIGDLETLKPLDQLRNQINVIFLESI
jgi:hypothetical protein